MRRRSDREREACFKVGLLKDGEHAPGVRNFELRVEVNLTVNRVNEAVEALAGVHVGSICHHHEFVVRGQVRELDSDAVRDFGGVQVGAVQRNAVDRCRDGVDER
ncbi:hypothetical protein D3C73_1138740 [compost metagenome]